MRNSQYHLIECRPVPSVHWVLVVSGKKTGKLPVTIYGKEYGAQMQIERMDMRADASTSYPGRGYRYVRGLLLLASCSNPMVSRGTHLQMFIICQCAIAS